MCSTVKLCVAKPPGLRQYSQRSSARARTTRRTATGTCSLGIAGARARKLLEHFLHRHIAQPGQRHDRRGALRVLLFDAVDESEKLHVLTGREAAFVVQDTK